MARKKKVVEVAEAVIAPVPEQPEVVVAVAPLYQAELANLHRQDYPPASVERFQTEYGPNLGYVYWGNIFNDRQVGGNHPFSDGRNIRTSLVRKEEEVDGVRYIHTLNTVYKVV